MELTIDKTLTAFAKLGDHFLENPIELQEVIERASRENNWLNIENIEKSIKSLSTWLQIDSLKEWVNSYDFKRVYPIKIGLIFAGNLPLVGFHDLLCVLAAGLRADIKLSSDDQVLPKYVIQKLIQFEPLLQDQIQIVEKLKDFDGVIATGSNNSSRYFEYYFGKKPHIIRKNRNSIAVLNGQETPEQLHVLGHDIFDYFGMGCRNVSKIFVPENYDIAKFYEGIAQHDYVKQNFKYFNNYEFHKSIYLINKVDHFDNGFLLVKKDENLASPLSVIFMEYYESFEKLESILENISDQIQCLVTEENLNVSIPKVAFGKSQEPRLMDYADRVDTMKFLKEVIEKTEASS